MEKQQTDFLTPLQKFRCRKRYCTVGKPRFINVFGVVFSCRGWFYTSRCCFLELGFSWYFDHLWQCKRIPMNANYSFGVLFNPIFSHVQESSTYFPLSWRFEESKLFRRSSPAPVQVCCRGDSTAKQETAGRDMLGTLPIKPFHHRNAAHCNQESITGLISKSFFSEGSLRLGFLIFDLSLKVSLKSHQVHAKQFLLLWAKSWGTINSSLGF